MITRFLKYYFKINIGIGKFVKFVIASYCPVSKSLDTVISEPTFQQVFYYIADRPKYLQCPQSHLLKENY